MKKAMAVAAHNQEVIWNMYNLPENPEVDMVPADAPVCAACVGGAAGHCLLLSCGRPNRKGTISRMTSVRALLQIAEFKLLVLWTLLWGTLLTMSQVTERFQSSGRRGL